MYSTLSPFNSSLVLIVFVLEVLRLDLGEKKKATQEKALLSSRGKLGLLVILLQSYFD